MYFLSQVRSIEFGGADCKNRVRGQVVLAWTLDWLGEGRKASPCEVECASYLPMQAVLLCYATCCLLSWRSPHTHALCLPKTVSNPFQPACKICLPVSTSKKCGEPAGGLCRQRVAVINSFNWWEQHMHALCLTGTS